MLHLYSVLDTKEVICVQWCSLIFTAADQAEIWLHNSPVLWDIQCETVRRAQVSICKKTS